MNYAISLYTLHSAVVIRSDLAFCSDPFFLQTFYEENIHSGRKPEPEARGTAFCSRRGASPRPIPKDDPPVAWEGSIRMDGWSAGSITPGTERTRPRAPFHAGGKSRAGRYNSNAYSRSSIGRFHDRGNSFRHRRLAGNDRRRLHLRQRPPVRARLRQLSFKGGKRRPEGRRRLRPAVRFGTFRRRLGRSAGRERLFGAADRRPHAHPDHLLGGGRPGCVRRDQHHRLAQSRHRQRLQGPRFPGRRARSRLAAGSGIASSPPTRPE